MGGGRRRESRGCRSGWGGSAAADTSRGSRGRPHCAVADVGALKRAAMLVGGTPRPRCVPAAALPRGKRVEGRLRGKNVLTLGDRCRGAVVDCGLLRREHGGVRQPSHKPRRLCPVGRQTFISVAVNVREGACPGKGVHRVHGGAGRRGQEGDNQRRNLNGHFRRGGFQTIRPGTRKER